MEMREEMGDENFFLFGLQFEEVEALKKKGYARTMDAISSFYSIFIWSVLGTTPTTTSTKTLS